MDNGKTMLTAWENIISHLARSNSKPSNIYSTVHFRECSEAHEKKRCWLAQRKNVWQSRHEKDRIDDTAASAFFMSFVKDYSVLAFQMTLSVVNHSL